MAIDLKHRTYPKEKPNHHETVLVDLVDLDRDEEFRWWLMTFYNDKFGESFTTEENGNEMFIPQDTGETFVWYRLKE